MEEDIQVQGQVGGNPVTEEGVDTSSDVDSVNEEALSLLSYFATEEERKRSEELLRNSPEYQEYLKWREQNQQAMQAASQGQQVDYAKVLSDPKEFGSFVESMNKNIQVQMMQMMNQVLELSEILYHLKVLEDKYPEISENPQALQVALMKARTGGGSARDVAERAVKAYMDAYRIRQNIVKNKNVLNVNTAKPLDSKTQARSSEVVKEDSPFEHILNAFRRNV